MPYTYQKDGGTYVVTGPPGEWHRRLQPTHMDVDAKLADMDEAGIDLTLISINDPGPDVFGNDGMAAARICNDYIGDLGKRYPKRFAGLIVLPPIGPKVSKPLPLSQVPPRSS
jgi:predicted TIM-barrel fold metal-dependent hydrolase